MDWYLNHPKLVPMHTDAHDWIHYGNQSTLSGSSTFDQFTQSMLLKGADIRRDGDTLAKCRVTNLFHSPAL